MLCELKIDAGEGDNQTIKYANADSFKTIDLDPSDVPDDRQHYLYVTPNRSQPESDCFAPVAWSLVATQLRAVQAADYGSFPARTTGQLDDFIDTIDTELTMTEHERNETAKAGLYVDYYDDIDEARTAFESGWDGLIDNWGRRLATGLDSARLVEEPESGPTVPTEHVVFDLPDGDDRRRNWLCRQGDGQWAWFFPTDWWTNLETGGPTYRGEKPNARVGFLHRPEFDREAVLGDHE